MTITSRSAPRTEYRRGIHTLCIAEPGSVFIHSCEMKSLADLAEFITALRQAALEAQLPSEPAKSEHE